MKNFNVAANFNSRLFLINGGIFRCGVKPQFAECAAVDSLSQDRGDITKVECPSKHRYGEFDEVYSFSGELSRVTTTLTTYMSHKSASQFANLFRDDCSFDLHVHFGECQNPSDFNQYDKALILSDVRTTSWGTDPLGVLSAADKGVVQETLEVSAAYILEVINLKYGRTGTASVTDGEIVAAVVADTKTCGGTCGDSSDGCQVVFMVTDDGFLYYSTDGGYNWEKEEAVDVATNVTSIPVDLVVVGDTIIVVTADDMLYSTSREAFLKDSSTATWDVTDISASATLAGSLVAADSAYDLGVLVGAGGVILSVDMYGEVRVEENGGLTASDLNAVDVGSEGVLIGGSAGTVLFSPDGTNFEVAVSAPSAAAISSVLMKSEKNWIVGTETGELWCTDNQGVTWERVTFPGWAGATTPVVSLQSSGPHVVYMIQNNKFLRSIDGGSSWIVQPSNTKTPFPTATLTTIAACYDDVNKVVVAGVNGGVGTVIVGEPN